MPILCAFYVHSPLWLLTINWLLLPKTWTSEFASALKKNIRQSHITEYNKLGLVDTKFWAT